MIIWKFDNDINTTIYSRASQTKGRDPVWGREKDRLDKPDINAFFN